MDKKPTILIILLAKNVSPWIRECLEQISLLDYPKELIDIAILENDSDDDTYQVISQAVSQKIFSSYRSITITKKDFNFKLPHTSRHYPPVQQDRIKNFVKIRNYAVNTFIKDQDYVWWIDADIKTIPSNAIHQLLQYNQDIIMPYYCIRDNNNNLIPYDGCTCKVINHVLYRLPDLLQYNPDIDIIQVDGVDGPVFCKSEVYKSGVRYHYDPSYYEGYAFSVEALNKGYKLYWTPKVPMEHQQIDGTKELS